MWLNNFCKFYTWLNYYIYVDFGGYVACQVMYY